MSWLSFSKLKPQTYFGGRVNFERMWSESLVHYRLQSTLNGLMAEAIAKDIKQEIDRKSKFQAVVVDFQDFDVEPKHLRPITSMGMDLRKIDKQMYALSQKKSVHFLIKSEGIANLMKPIFALEEVEILDLPAIEPLKLDVSFINPFIDGTLHVFKVTCQTTAEATKPLLKEDTHLNVATEISGVINITSPAYSGTIAICFPAEVFLRLISRMLGEEFKEINQEIEDGAAEILNMVFGHAKTVLNSRGHSFEKAIPVVKRGENPILVTGDDSLFVLPFASDIGNFHMEFTTDLRVKQ